MINSKKRPFLGSILLSFCLTLFFASPPSLFAEENYDDVLGGFEKETVEEGQNGDDSDAYGDVLGGFEEGDNQAVASAEEDSGKSDTPFYELRGFLHLGTSYNFSHHAPEAGKTDYRGLQKLQTKLNLELDINFNESWKLRSSGLAFYDSAYALHGRKNYTDQVLQFNESELRLYNLYLLGTLSSSVDVRIGRQIVVWGKSENLRVADVLNPMDFREPGLTDIKDLRLPVTMGKLDYYIGHWDLSAIVIPEIRFNINAPAGSDFAISSTPLPYEKQPPNGLTRAEFAFAPNSDISGRDVSFYYANKYDDTPHLAVDQGRITRRHSRLNMLGSAINIASGNMLYKGELAYFDGLEFFALPKQKKARLDMLFGLEYSGFRDTTISVDIANRHLLGYRETLRGYPDYANRNRFQSSLRISKDFLNQELTLTYFLTVNGASGQEGAFHRFSADYDYSDHITITGGILNFFNGNSAYAHALKDSDRLFFNFHYTF